MTKQEFKKALTRYFTFRGFCHKSSHFYYDSGTDFVIVFGLQMSNYGDYCYMEHGYCIKQISKDIPFPKTYQLNLNAGRLMFGRGKTIVFSECDNEYMLCIEEKIDEEFKMMLNLVNEGKDKLIDYYLIHQQDKSWYVLSDRTAGFFGKTRNDFQFHFVDEG